MNEREEQKDREEGGRRRVEKKRGRPRDARGAAAAELFGPNRRQPPGKGSMQIRARLGARREGGEGGSSGTAMKGARRHRSKRLDAREEAVEMTKEH